MKKLNFTYNRLSKLRHDGSKKRNLYHDEKQSGLMLCIMPTGTKIFKLNKWSKKHGKTFVITYGKFPDVTINEARTHAANDVTRIHNGEHIYEEKKKAREEDTFAAVFYRWLEQYAKPHKKSWDEDKRRYSLYMEKQFRNKKISWFTLERVREWHFGITKMKKQRGGEEIISGHKKDTDKVVIHYVTQSTANRALALLSTVFNTMFPFRPNPCKGVKKFKEQSRDRFLQPEELKRFFKALESEDTKESIRDYVLLSLFTGARRSNVLSMKWNDIDFEHAIWIIPAKESKNAEPLVIPCPQETINILLRRKSQTTSIFIFPSTASKTGHMVEPRKGWVALLKRAEISDLRIHDLRRTLGSWQTMSGASSTIVGKTLGHKSPSATAVYTRLNLDPVRASMEKAVEAMLKTQELPDKISKITAT
jgi:integrase